MMKIQFTQVYPEVNTSFSLFYKIIGVLKDKINSLKKEIKYFKDKYNWDEFDVTFYISATRKSDILEVKGPTILRKDRDVEFVIFIPYKDIGDQNEKISYVLHQVGKGVELVFQKYKADSSGIQEAIQDVIQQVRNTTP